MYSAQCGAEVPHDAKYCMKCGARVSIPCYADWWGPYKPLRPVYEPRTGHTGHTGRILYYMAVLYTKQGAVKLVMKSTHRPYRLPQQTTSAIKVLKRNMVTML